MNVKPLLDFIAKCEGTGNNYNAVYSNARATEDLSQFTLQQIHDKQYAWGKLKGSSAFGRYQILRKTLLRLRDVMGLYGTAKFTPELQDELCVMLLHQRGFSIWEAGRMSDNAFMDSLSKEWASLPYRTGRSYYEGDSIGNHARATRNEFKAALNAARNAT